jgi:hypothetical protein
MNNKLSNPWGEPNADKFNFDEHARNQDANDPFGSRLVDNVPGSLERQLLQLAATNDEVQDVLRENNIDLPTVPKSFRLSHGEIGTIVADANGLWKATIMVDGQTLTFQSEGRDSAMMAAERCLEKNRGPRPLTESELIRVARLTQSGGTVEAIELYVALSLDGKDRRSEREILEDPKYKGLLNAAAITIWKFSRQDYVPDEEFEELLQRAASIKPLTVHVVDSLYDKFQDHKSEAARFTRRTPHATLPENEPVPSQEQVTTELESLGDSALETLRTKTLRHRGHLVRQFNEQMFGR